MLKKPSMEKMKKIRKILEDYRDKVTSMDGFFDNSPTDKSLVAIEKAIIKRMDKLTKGD